MYKFLAFVLLIPCVALAETATSAEKLQIIGGLKQEITEQYVLEDKITAILTSLDTLSASKALQQATGNAEFAKIIDKNLKHFDRHFSFKWKAENKIDDYQPRETYWEKLARKNSGFNKVEILAGNVGYIEFWGFDKVNRNSTERVANVMAMVSDTSAIIFDLRNNGGGHPEMSQLLSSYFFKNRTHLNDIYWRYSGEVDEFWTFRKVKGKKLVDIPIYILTSKRTFSAAEEFAYSLQSLKRALIVGEVTAGGAHPMRFIDVGHGFVAGIPYGKAINPVTNTNWEWIGVKPDLITTDKSAFNLAYFTVLKNLMKTDLPAAERVEINSKLEELAVDEYALIDGER